MPHQLIYKLISKKYLLTESVIQINYRYCLCLIEAGLVLVILTTSHAHYLMYQIMFYSLVFLRLESFHINGDNENEQLPI